MSAIALFCQQPGCGKYANDKVDGVRYCRRHARAAGLRSDQIPRDKRWRHAEEAQAAQQVPVARGGPRTVTIGQQQFEVVWDGTF